MDFFLYLILCSHYAAFSNLKLTLWKMRSPIWMLKGLSLFGGDWGPLTRHGCSSQQWRQLHLKVTGSCPISQIKTCARLGTLVYWITVVWFSKGPGGWKELSSAIHWNLVTFNLGVGQQLYPDRTLSSDDNCFVVQPFSLNCSVPEGSHGKRRPCVSSRKEPGITSFRPTKCIELWVIALWVFLIHHVNSPCECAPLCFHRYKEIGGSLKFNTSIHCQLVSASRKTFPSIGSAGLSLNVTHSFLGLYWRV